MIQYEIKKSDFIKSVQITGHANQNEYGNDIVCASVSTAIIMTVNQLEILKKKLSFTLEEGKFILKVSSYDEIIENVLCNLVYTLNDLEIQYPKYIKKL